MKYIKLHKEIESTSAETLLKEIPKMKENGWEVCGDMYIDNGKGRSCKKYKLYVLRFFKKNIC